MLLPHLQGPAYSCWQTTCCFSLQSLGSHSHSDGNPWRSPGTGKWLGQRHSSHSEHGGWSQVSSLPSHTLSHPDGHGWFLSPFSTGTRVCEEQPTVLSGLQTDKKNLRNASGEITVSQCDPWLFGFMFCYSGKGRLWFRLALLHFCSLSKPPGSPP